MRARRIGADCTARDGGFVAAKTGTIENYPADEFETVDAPNHPANPALGTRPLRLGRSLYIDADDYRDEPPGKYFRLAPGREVRLRYGFVVKCTEVIRDAAGKAIELRCQYDPATRHGAQPDGRKVKGIIHWVNADDAVDATVKLYDRLFSVANPLAVENDDAHINDTSHNFRKHINPQSLQVCHNAKLEPSLADANRQTRYQFERLGYFIIDSENDNELTFNRIVTLRDSWAKIDRQRAS